MSNVKKIDDKICHVILKLLITCEIYVQQKPIPDPAHKMKQVNFQLNVV